MFKDILPESLGFAPYDELATAANPEFNVETNTPAILHRLDLQSEDVLDMLGYQFHVEGWDLIRKGDLAKKRNMIRISIELHRRKGTPFAVRRAISETLGIPYADVLILEHTVLPRRLDGTWKLDGTVTLNGGDQHWAAFDVVFVVNNPSTAFRLQQEGIDLVVRCINEYKNARSWLGNITYRFFVIVDVPPPTTSGNVMAYRRTYLDRGYHVQQGIRPMPFLRLDGSWMLSGEVLNQKIEW